MTLCSDPEFEQKPSHFVTLCHLKQACRSAVFASRRFALSSLIRLFSVCFASWAAQRASASEFVMISPWSTWMEVLGIKSESKHGMVTRQSLITEGGRASTAPLGLYFGYEIVTHNVRKLREFEGWQTSRSWEIYLSPLTIFGPWHTNCCLWALQLHNSLSASYSILVGL